MTHDFKPYTEPKKLSESEILLHIKHMVAKSPTGRNVYETEQIITLLNIIHRQQKELSDCKKHLNNMIIWKNRFWLSIQKIENSGYHRKNGLQGKRVFGYSVRLRVLGKELI